MNDDDPKFTKSGRFGRLVKMGSLAASVTGAAVARKLAGRFQAEEERDAAARQQLVDSGRKIVRAMGEMKGAAMKVGQMLSIAPEHLPRELLDELKVLQKEAPSMPYEMVAECIDRGLGAPLRDVFAYFDPKPLGAASIGQVHRARLFDGRMVAVKVQYPGIAETLESDVKNIGSMLTVARAVADKQRLDDYLEEVRKGLLEEADYELEANSLDKYGAMFAAQPQVVVPKVIREFSSKTVLTMQLIEGEKLDVGLAQVADPEKRNQIAIDFSFLYIWMFHERHVLHADPHPGNFLLTPDHKIGLLDFGCVREYDPKFTDGWLDVLVCKWTHNRDRLVDVFDTLGFATKSGSKPVDAKQLSDLLEITCAPFLYDREFDWGTWNPVKSMETFIKGNLGFLKYSAPPAAIFYYRVAAGVWGFLQRNQIHGNWYRHVRALAERRGRI